MLRLSKHLIEETFRIFNECGRGQCECVVYWTAPVNNHELADGWDHPTHRRSPFGYQIDDEWLTDYWFRLSREKRAIRAQIHTHPTIAFHSQTDDHWPVISQPGFISIVIPNFAMGPINLEDAWAGCLTAEGDWREISMSIAIRIIS